MPLVFFILASFSLVNNHFAFAKGQASRAAAESSQAPSSVIPFPPQILECQSSIDCSAVHGVCGEWITVNKKNEKPLEKFYSQQAAQAECVRAKDSSKPKLECRKGFCGRTQTVGAAESSISLWKDQCPPRDIEGSIESIDDPLKTQILRLHSNLGWERREAIDTLTKMGPGATIAIPWVLAQLKNRESFAVSKDAKCFIGDLPTEDSLITTLGQIDPTDHPALPLFVEWLKDEKQLYRHTEILKHLSKMGPKAAAALGVLEDILSKGSDQKWTDERGLLALDVAVGLGIQAKTILSSMQKWVEQASTMKVRLLTAMIKIDSENVSTKKAALYCLKQNEDSSCRMLALNFLNRYPSELLDQLDLLKKMLNAPENVQYRMAALRAIQGLGTKGKTLVEDVARLGLQNQEDLRRLAALVLKSIDPEGKQSLSILKKKVYQGFAFEPQYLWKVIDSQLTRIELLKSYFYFVTGKRYKFSELKMAPEMERQLVNCINSPECPNRTSAMAAVVLLKSQDPRLPEYLVNAMNVTDSAIRWDASGAYILMYGQGSSNSKSAKDLTKAWSLQDEALQQGGSVRLIDLEDILLSTNVNADKKLQFVSQRFKNGDNMDSVDGLLLMANQDVPGTRKLLAEIFSGGDKHKIVTVLNRMGLLRNKLSPWFRELNGMVLNHSESTIQETAVLNQMSLSFN